VDVLEHLALVKYVATFFPSQIHGESLEDSELFSDGMIGLCKAGKSFKQNGNKFSTHAVACIKNEMIGGLRRRVEKLDVVPFCDVLESLEDAQFEPIDERRCQTKKMAAEFVEEILASEYHSTHAKLLKQYYLEGKTLQDIGGQWGITREAVRKRIKRSLEYVQKKFEKEIDKYILRGLELQ